MVDINVIREDCFLDEILTELPNRVAKPTPGVKGNNLKKIFHQFSDSLKDISLQYTCIDVSSVAFAFGTNVGNAYVYQRKHKKILKISSETKYVSTTCIKLAAGCTTVAFGHECGTFSVGLVDPPIHKTFDSLTAEDVHHSSITCLEWSNDGLILYAGDGDGKISMSVVKISEGILQTAIIVTEDCSVVQLCYGEDALLISTMKRSVLWSFHNETLIQVGEKERKTSGAFGGCFIPDTLREPTKKLYAARPGLRLWTADESGKVSSTSVFKSLLADKPAVIRTLIGNDSKFNSSGQFGQLLIFYNRYVITWDTNHIWVLDLNLGNVIGCHSNLGKIRDVAVCGHEVFVLVNQRERFLRRFILTTERVLDSSCLDAVIAGSEDAGEAETEEGAEKSGFNLASALMIVPFMALESDESSQAAQNKDSGPEITSSLASVESTVEVGGPPESDIFDKINAIPLLDEGQGDIVFTAAKKKKKKKKQKQTSVQAEETSSEGQTKIELPGEPEFPGISTQHAEARTTTTAEEMTSNDMEPRSNLETVLPNTTKSHEELPNIVQDTESVTLAAILDKNTPQREIHDEATNDEANQTKGEEKQGLGTVQISDAANTNDSPDKAASSLTEVNTRAKDNILEQEAIESTGIEAKIETGTSTTQQTPAPQETTTANEQKNLTAQNTQAAQATLTVQETLAKEHEIQNITDPSTDISSTSRQDSTDSTDVYRNSSDLSRLDSHEDDRPKSPEASKDSKASKPLPKDDHVPLLADTWSGRSLPTTQTIEQLAISQKYIFCIDSRSRVYFSDPNTASCSGWEKADFKAKQIYVNSACDFISYIDHGKAFVRGNISATNPVGNASFQILDEVSLLTTCSTCTWALTADNTLRRVDTAAFAKLKSDVKSSSSWKIEDSKDSLAQIVCYDNILWGRTPDEMLLVYPGRTSGRKTTWKNEDKQAKWLHMSDDGTVWIITPDDQIWFKPHVAASCPTGEEWYQVTLGQYIIDDPSILESTFNFFSSVGSAYRIARTTEYLRHAAKGLLQSTKDMAFSLFRDGGSPKQIYCNMQSGIWLLDTRNTLHACRGQATGAYWDMVCPTGTAKSATWRCVTTGLAGYIWAIQPNGDFTCFHPKGPSYNVECPSSRGVDFMSGSPHGMWCFVTEQNSKVHIRDGISEDYPQGFAWTSLSLHHQEIGNIKHLSVGAITVWAVDSSGQVWIRIGSIGGDERSVLAQAWLALDNPKHIEFISVEVNCKDSMVWAIDAKGSVYARDGVKEDFVVGQQWREVEGVTLKSVCLSSYVVYGLCTTGEIVCRFGVSEENYIGDYWKKIPGCFPQISVNSAGELWAISEDEKLNARKMKCLVFLRGEGKEGEGKEGKGGEEGVDDGGSHGDGGDDGGEWELI